MQYGDREVRCKGTHTSRDSSLILVGNSRKESDTDAEAGRSSSERDMLLTSDEKYGRRDQLDLLGRNTDGDTNKY